MDRQLIFTNTLEHLRHQGHASSVKAGTGHTRCFYFAPNGDRCAIGIHMGQAPSYEIEGLSVPSLVELHPELLEHLKIENEVDRGFLKALQVAHDVSLTRSLKAWESKMQSLAYSFGLVYTPPEEGGEKAAQQAKDVLQQAKAKEAETATTD